MTAFMDIKARALDYRDNIDKCRKNTINEHRKNMKYTKSYINSVIKSFQK